MLPSSRPSRSTAGGRGTRRLKLFGDDPPRPDNEEEEEEDEVPVPLPPPPVTSPEGLKLEGNVLSQACSNLYRLSLA